MTVVEEKSYGVDEVFNLIGTEMLLLQDDKQQRMFNIEVDGFKVYPISIRYETFYQKGTKCVCCGKVGTHFKLCGESDTNRRHFNLYADDGSLMTKDHIIPRSKGGKDNVENMQPMCEQCNKAKGNSHPDIKINYIVATDHRSGQDAFFRTINNAALHLINNYIHPSKDDPVLIAKTSICAVLAIQSALVSGSPYCGFSWRTELK